MRSNMREKEATEGRWGKKVENNKRAKSKGKEKKKKEEKKGRAGKENG